MHELTTNEYNKYRHLYHPRPKVPLFDFFPVHSTEVDTEAPYCSEDEVENSYVSDAPKSPESRGLLLSQPAHSNTLKYAEALCYDKSYHYNYENQPYHSQQTHSQTYLPRVHANREPETPLTDEEDDSDSDINSSDEFELLNNAVNYFVRDIERAYNPDCFSDSESDMSGSEYTASVESAQKTPPKCVKALLSLFKENL